MRGALLLPPAYDVVWSVLVLGQLVLLLLALVQWFRARATRDAGLLDLVVIAVLPVLGPAAYLLARRGAAGRRRGASGTGETPTEDGMTSVTPPPWRTHRSR